MVLVSSGKKKTPNKFDEIMSSPIASGISVICTVLGFSISLFDNIITRIIAIVLLFLTVIFWINKFFSYKNNKKNIIDNFGEEIWEIIKTVNSNYKDSFDEINKGSIASYQHLNNLLKPLSDCVADLSRLIINEKSSICIKMIETESLMNNDIDTWKLRTIARSKSTKPHRKNKDNKSILLSQNSDFYTIIKGGESAYSDCFAVPSLPRLEKLWKEQLRLEYKNSNINYKREYSSTIVFPIKTSIESVSNIIKNQMNYDDNADYHIIGFLCWDSKKEFDDDDDSFSLLTEMIGSFSEILYPLLEKYIVYQLDNVELPSAIVSSNT